MAANSVVSKVATAKGECGTANWTISNWSAQHKIVVATEASCRIEVSNPKIKLRFFLRPKEKLFSATYNSGYASILANWYSLWVEVLTPLQNTAIKLTASVNSIGQQPITKDGTIVLNKSKENFVEVIDEFIHLNTFNVDSYGQKALAHHGFALGNSITELTITITAELFRLIENDKTVAQSNGDNVLQAEAEESLTHDLKNMFVEVENFADLKLETKDYMTLDAHKFILAARSRYLRKYIEDAMKKEKFDGSIKIDINGKPLTVILHWMYSGELHENADKVMEEVVDAAILFELSHLMKVLDRKLVTICNKENMFRLYQVAQKNGMPNAMDDISVYIRENL